jgi:NAD(P)-dependent dehydrogenase (short-subunit alcohol dehydrogenase family)
MSENTALVVGGTSGIGLATARKLRAMGATVHLVGRSKERLDTVAATDPDLNSGTMAHGGLPSSMDSTATAVSCGTRGSGRPTPSHH